MDRGRAALGRQPPRARPAGARRAAPRPGRHPDPQLGRAVPDAARGVPGRLAVRAAEHPPHRGRGRVHPRRLGRGGAGRRRRVRRRSRRAAAGRGGRPAGRSDLGGWRDPRLHAARRRCSPTSPTRTPGAPGRRAVHAVHVGHDRATEGGAAGPAAVRPRDLGRRLQRQPHPLRHRARRRRGAPGHVADVPPVAAQLRLLLAALRAHRRADGTVGRRARAAADRAVPRHRRRDGADPAAPAHAAARSRARAVRRVVAAPGDPRGGAVPDRAQAPAVRRGSAR